MKSIPKPEFPRPERQRHDWQNLNGEWDFCLFPEGNEKAEAAFAAGERDYDSRITVPFSWAAPLSGVQKNEPGIGWYRREAEFAFDGRVFLCFGAVDYDTLVLINGEEAGRHTGGYDYFELDVTSLWKKGRNTIEVRAEDYRREDQLYGKQGYGEIQGIWQTVWLEARPEAYIDDFTIVTELDGTVDIGVEADAPDGAVVTAVFDGVSASAQVQSGMAAIRLQFDAPRLWSPEDPQLYDGTLTLEWDSAKDTVSTYFGIRQIGQACFKGNDYPWITLNGKPVFLNGTLDQAFNPQGYFTYPDEDEIIREVWRLKRIGLNMVRIHIKAEEPRKLYWMDRMGMLVMEDIPCFWGEPNRKAMEAYEREWPCILRRDRNHPSTFAWVMFNETWGLLHRENGKKVYRPETQKWVKDVYRRAKAMDPTRLVEDNSACRYDHVESDLNTWHFYMNGYEQIKAHLDEVTESTHPGSEFNYIGGNKQNGAPLMNSECGLVWGVDHSAGDSDIAWHYHYMINEFRLRNKLCGFVFTEFHDVVNEFNGYYRIDGEEKDFGYEDYCRGMTLRDLHAADMVLTDCPPIRNTAAGEEVEIPLYISSFSDELHHDCCSVRWELWHNGLEGRVTDGEGTLPIDRIRYGVSLIGVLNVTMPRENAAEVLSLYLQNEEGEVVSRNFVTFNVRADLPENSIEIPVGAGKAEGFSNVWQAMEGEKLCLGGEGTVSYRVSLPKDLNVNSMTLYMELSSKRVLAKDRMILGKKEQDHAFMRGYLVDRGAFDNSYWMTDESRLPSTVEVWVGEEKISTLQLENDWADARGMLSWNRQSKVRHLDEAGSYGEEKRVRIPGRLLRDIQREGELMFSLRVKGNGLALYGRECGRYAHGLLLVME